MLEKANTKLHDINSQVNVGSEKSWDIFISYSSKDSEWVDKLYNKLNEKGLEIWYDNSELSIGDNLRKNINIGLNNCKFGVVVLSKDFIESFWPNREYDSLYHLMDEGRLFLIVRGLTKDQIEEFDKPLGNIIYRDASKFSIDEITDEIFAKVNKINNTK